MKSITPVVAEYDSPFRFERKITPTPGKGPLIVDYKIKNLNDALLPNLWAAHPLFALAPGMAITLPASLCRTKAYLLGFELAPECERFICPRATRIGGTNVDFSRVPACNAGMAITLFSETPNGSRVSITTADGREEMRMSLAGETMK